MSLMESPKLIIILALIALGSSGYNFVSNTDSVDIQKVEEKFQNAEFEAQRRLDDMDKKIQIEVRLITAPLENEVQNLKDTILDQRDRINELEKQMATLTERTRP